MAKSARASQRSGKNLPRGSGQESIRQQRTGGQDNNSIGWPEFHSVIFKDKPVVDVMGLQGGETLSSNNIFTDLHGAYTNYCKLIKIKPVEINPELSLSNKVILVYNSMKKLIEKECISSALNIDAKDSGEYFFLAYHYYHDHGDTIWLYPLRFLELLEIKCEKLYNVMLPFLSHVFSKTGFTDVDSNGHLGYTVQMLDEQANEISEDDPKQALSLINSAQKYISDGPYEHQLSLLRKIKCKLDSSFTRKVLAVKPPDRHHAFLKQWLLDGIEIFKRPDVKNLMTMEYDDYQELNETREGDRVGLDRIFTIAYDCDDHVCCEYVEGINMDIGEYSAHTPCEWHLIDKKTKHPYKHSDWYVCFIKWMASGFMQANKYIDIFKT